MKKESPLALISGAADNLLYNIFENLSVGLELYDKSGFMVEVNHTELKSMGVRDREELLGRNLFNIPSLSDEFKQQIVNGETVHFMAEYDFDSLRSCFKTYLWVTLFSWGFNICLKIVSLPYEIKIPSSYC